MADEGAPLPWRARNTWDIADATGTLVATIIAPDGTREEVRERIIHAVNGEQALRDIARQVIEWDEAPATGRDRVPADVAMGRLAEKARAASPCCLGQGPRGPRRETK